MKLSWLFAVALALVAVKVPCAQGQISTSDQWWAYLADYEGRPGSIRVDMGPKGTAPLAEFPFVVIVGTNYAKSLATGLPDPIELERLNALSEKLVSAVMALGPSLYVGTFTHNNEQLHYIYVKDVGGAEEAFTKALRRECTACEAIFRTRGDPNWNAYLKFLYPSQATMDFYKFEPKQSRTYRQ